MTTTTTQDATNRQTYEERRAAKSAAYWKSAAEFDAQGTAVAAELATITGQPFSYHADEREPGHVLRAKITGPDCGLFYSVVQGNAARLQVSPMYPKELADYRDHNNEAGEVSLTAARSKSPAVIARDIARRILDNITKETARRRARHEESTAAAQAATIAAEQITEGTRWNVEPLPDNARPADAYERKAETYRTSSYRGEMRITRNTVYELKLNSLSHRQARAVLEALETEEARQAAEQEEAERRERTRPAASFTAAELDAAHEAAIKEAHNHDPYTRRLKELMQSPDGEYLLINPSGAATRIKPLEEAAARELAAMLSENAPTGSTFTVRHRDDDASR